MPSFQIQDYTVSSILERYSGDTAAKPSRVLYLTSAAEYHNIVNHATLAFSHQFDMFNEPVAGYLTLPAGYEGIRITGWFPLAEFTYYYDILRSEQPVFLTYELSTEPRLTNYIRQLGITTHAEPVGEGPSDAGSTMSVSSLMKEVYSKTKLSPPLQSSGL